MITFNTFKQLYANKAGLLVRSYGEASGQQTYAYVDSFFTQSRQLDGSVLIRFKAHSFRNLLNQDVPENIVDTRSGENLIESFWRGLLGIKL